MKTNHLRKLNIDHTEVNCLYQEFKPVKKPLFVTRVGKIQFFFTKIAH